MSKMAISAGKTVTNCQFSPKISIKTYMLKTAFSQKSEKYWKMHGEDFLRFLTKWHCNNLWPRVFTKLAILAKIKKCTFLWLQTGSLKLGFIRWTPSIYQQILKTNEKRRNLIKGWQSYTVLMTLKYHTVWYTVWFIQYDSY